LYHQMVNIEGGNTVVVKRRVEFWMPNPIAGDSEGEFSGNVWEMFC